MIQLEGVQKQVGSFQLNVNALKVGPGLTLVVGKNGAGKSTLLNVLVTALAADRGTITYAGKRAEDDLALIRSRLGYLPTDIDYYPQMTVGQLLAHIGELKGLPPQDLEEDTRYLLKQFALADVAGERIANLSEGRQRSLGIVQALLGQPVFLFLDEPLTSLDIVEQKRAVSFLYRYAARRYVVVVSHELYCWEGQCDSIVWIDEGGVAFHGTPEEWVAHPDLAVWEGTVSLRKADDLQRRYRVVRRQQVEGGQGDPLAQHVRLIAAECPGASFSPAAGTLEDGYFLRTKHVVDR